MWKEHLERIRQEEKKYGQDINCGISEGKAEMFIKAVKDELGIALPEEYLEIKKENLKCDVSMLDGEVEKRMDFINVLDRLREIIDKLLSMILVVRKFVWFMEVY